MKIRLPTQLLICFISSFLFGSYAYADTLKPTPSLHAKVIQVMSKDPVNASVSIEAELRDGQLHGQYIFIARAPEALSVGEVFFVDIEKDPTDGSTQYLFADYDRTRVDAIFIGMFILCAIVFGGIQGVRGLLSLAVSILLIFAVLLPGIAHGYSPAFLSICVSFLVIVIGSYVTHGFNNATSAAVIGMLATLMLTGSLAYVGVHAGHLNGYAVEGASDFSELGIATSYDFQSILFGAILIGLLGVLIDIAVGQAVAVEELFRMDPRCSKTLMYQRGLRIGREHIGTLINILAILYVSSALPLLLLYLSPELAFSIHRPLINLEVFSTEIIRVMIESIGLILAVPITTLLSVFFLSPKTA